MVKRSARDIKSRKEILEELASGREEAGRAVDVYASILKNHPQVDITSVRLARELIYAHGLLMSYADEYLRPYELSWSKLAILLWLRAYQEEQPGSGLMPSMLSELIGVGRNTISTLLDGLERQGYVSRELDAEDKRRFIIRLTPPGQTVAYEALAALTGRLEVLLQPMDAPQRENMIRSLLQFQQILLRQPK